MGILTDIMNQWSDPYRRTVALHGVNVEGGFPGSGTAAGQNYGGPGYYYQVYMGGNPYGGNSVSKPFQSSAEAVRFAAENPKFYNSAGQLVGPAFQAGGFGGFDTNAFASRFVANPIGATDDQVHRIEASASQRSATNPYHYTQTPNVWNNVTYPNLNTLGIDPATYRPNPAGGGSQPAPLSYQQPVNHAPSQGIINGVNRFTPPGGGDINQWSWDQNQGRYFKKGDAGKPYTDIPYYSYDYGTGTWTGNNTAVRGQSLPQGMGMGGTKAAQQQMPPQQSTFTTQRQPMNNTPSTALGPNGMSLQQATQFLQQNVRTSPQMGTFNANPQGQMYVANGNGGGMYRSPVNMSSFQQARPPQIPMQSPIMGFGAGRPSLPVTPMGGGMANYQGGQYSANGLALSRMQSGLF